MWRSEGVTVAERDVPLRGTATTVRVQERGQGSPVVFVHGASNSGVSWAQLVARLDDRRCIVLDRPGCGLSAPLPHRLADPRALATFADRFLADVFDGLGLDQADVVSTSFGGYFALRAAAAHPDRFRRIVHLGWSVGAPSRPLPLMMRIANVPLLGKLMARLPVSDRMVRSMFRRIGLRGAVERGLVSDDLVSCFGSLLRDTATMRNEVSAGPRMIRLRGGMDPDVLLRAELLASVRSPVLLLWGTDDPMGGPDEARRFASMLPNGQLALLPDAGHAPWIDDPAGVATSVRGFLS